MWYIGWRGHCLAVYIWYIGPAILMYTRIWVLAVLKFDYHKESKDGPYIYIYTYIHLFINIRSFLCMINHFAMLQSNICFSSLSYNSFNWLELLNNHPHGLCISISGGCQNFTRGSSILSVSVLLVNFVRDLVYIVILVS